jgi:hypothetical protein
MDKSSHMERCSSRWKEYGTPRQWLLRRMRSSPPAHEGVRGRRPSSTVEGGVVEGDRCDCCPPEAVKAVAEFGGNLTAYADLFGQ